MLKLAWRNIWRKRGRSFFTSLAMALVVMFTMLQSGIMGAVKNALFTTLVNTGGHIQIHPVDYREARDFGDTLIRDAAQLGKSLVAALPANTNFVEVLQTGGLLEGSEGRSRGIGLIGIKQPEHLRETFSNYYVVEGKLPEDSDVESIALGIKLAKSLKINLGDTVYMYTSNTEGYGAAAYTVIGFLDIAGSQAMAYTSLLATQELAAPDAVSRVEIHLSDFNKISDDAKLPPVKADLLNMLGDAYSVETWGEVNPGLKGYLDIIGPVSLVFLAIFFILAGLVVMNTIYLSIIERVREFGVMMALGLGRAKVMLMVFHESLFLCGVGALLGALIGGLLLWQTSKGVKIAAFNTFFEGFPDTLYTSISLERVITIMVFVFVTGVLAALWPARAAGRLEPVEAMRFTA